MGGQKGVLIQTSVGVGRWEIKRKALEFKLISNITVSDEISSVKMS